MNKQTVVITGAASGIGLAIAKAFYKASYQVVMTDIDLDNLARSAKSIGEDVIYHKLDVTDHSQWETVISDIVMKTGSLNCLVNNAGIGSPNDIEHIDETHWDMTIDINLKGVMWGCHYAIEEIKKVGGSIINIASIMGKTPMSNVPAYAASKAGVIALTKSVALWCAEQSYPIRCNSILPGFIRTSMMDQAINNSDDPEGTLKAFQKLSPTNQLVNVQNIADMALYLNSESAKSITGTEFTIDCGYCI